MATCLLLSAFCFLPSAFGQSPSPVPQIQTNDLQIITPPLGAVTTVNTQLVGQPGVATYYYWVVASYTAGRASPSPAVIVTNAPNVLSPQNYVQVYWQGVAGATTYDLLRTTTPTLPSGPANIAVVIGTAGTSFSDNGGSLGSYTVSPAPAGQVAIEATPLGLRINGSYGSNGQCFGSTGGNGATWNNCSGASGIFASFQFSTNPAITTSGNYFRLVPGTGLSASTYSGSGTSGSPYVATLNLAATIASNTTGNAATATALAANPSLCGAGQAAQGVLASGNATGCFTPTGSGTVNSGTANHLAIYPSTGTAVNSDADLDDGASAANTLTYSGIGGYAGSQYNVTGTCGVTGSGIGLFCIQGTQAALPSAGPAAGKAGFYADASAASGWAGSSGTSPPYALSGLIASGTATLGTTAIASGACATVVTVAATGVVTTDVIQVGFNGDPTGVTGYGVSSSGAVLTIYAYPTANAANFKVCNSFSASITPGAMTLNFRVSR